METCKLGRTTINFLGHHIITTSTQLVEKHVDVDVIQQFPLLADASNPGVFLVW
jgi:hypothetical protein